MDIDNKRIIIKNLGYITAALISALLIFFLASYELKAETRQSLISDFESLPTVRIIGPDISMGAYQLSWKDSYLKEFSVLLYESHNNGPWNITDVSTSSVINFQDKPEGIYKYSLQVCIPKDGSKKCRFVTGNTKEIRVSKDFNNVISERSTEIAKYKKPTKVFNYEVINLNRNSRLISQASSALRSYGLAVNQKYYNILVSEELYIIENPELTDTSILINLDTQVSYILNHKTKSYQLKKPLDKELEEEKEFKLSFNEHAKSRWSKWGNTRLKEKRYTLDLKDVMFEFWLIPNNIVAPEVVQQYWKSILPNANPDSYPPSMPSEIKVVIKNQPNGAVLHIRLNGISSIDREYSVPPREYRLATKNSPLMLGRHTNGDPDLPGPPSSSEPTSQPIADYGFVIKQDALDQIREALNRMTNVFDTFYPRYHGSQLRINWWEQITWSLNCGRPETTERILGQLKKLPALWKIISKSELIGLSEELAQDLDAQKLRTGWDIFFDEYNNEKDQYQAIFDLVHLLNINQEATGVSNDPVLRQKIIELNNIYKNEIATAVIIIAGAGFGDALKIEGLFSSNRLLQLEQYQFDEFTKVRYLDMPSSVSANNTYVSGKIWGLEPEVSLSHPTVTGVNYSGSSIRTNLSVKQIWVDFEFATWPTTNAINVIGGLITGGLNYALLSNVGVGYFNVDNAEIAIKVVEQLSPNENIAGFKIELDKPSSEMDTSAFLVGANIASDVIDIITGLIYSLGDLLNDEILDILEESINDIQGSGIYFWPHATWHMSTFNEEFTKDNRFDINNSSLYGILSTEMGSNYKTYENPGSIDITNVDSLGYVFSNNYIINWVKLLTKHFKKTAALSQNWENDLDVTLPALEALPQSPVDQDCVFDADDFMPGIQGEAEQLITNYVKSKCPEQTLSWEYQSRLTTEIEIEPASEGVVTSIADLVINSKVALKGMRRERTPHIKTFWCPDKFPDDLPDWASMPAIDIFTRVRADACPTYRFVEKQVLIKEFLRARKNYSMKLEVGFDINGDILFPELGMARNNVSFGQLTIEHLEQPFINLDTTALKEYLDTVTDEPIMNNIDNTKFISISLNRDISPWYLGIEFDPILTKAVIFNQDNDEGNPLYLKKDDMIYMPITFEEKFTQDCLISE